MKMKKINQKLMMMVLIILKNLKMNRMKNKIYKIFHKESTNKIRKNVRKNKKIFI